MKNKGVSKKYKVVSIPTDCDGVAVIQRQPTSIRLRTANAKIERLTKEIDHLKRNSNPDRLPPSRDEFFRPAKSQIDAVCLALLDLYERVRQSVPSVGDVSTAKGWKSHAEKLQGLPKAIQSHRDALDYAERRAGGALVKRLRNREPLKS